jgi:hypothetical protein
MIGPLRLGRRLIQIIAGFGTEPENVMYAFKHS